MRTAAAIAALTILLAPPAPARAEQGSPGAGKKLAQEQCAKCHAIERGEAAKSEAPAFSEVARSEHNARSIRVFLRTPHATMPLIVLDDNQREDIAAYIMSLREE